MKNAFFLSETEHNLSGEKPEVELLFQKLSKSRQQNMPVTFIISHFVRLCEQINYRSGKENFQQNSKKAALLWGENPPQKRFFLPASGTQGLGLYLGPHVFPLLDSVVVHSSEDISV